MDSEDEYSSYNTFHPFPRLPPELRNKIWLFALPWDLPAALYAYKSVCWHGRHLRPDEWGFDPQRTDANRALEYRHDLLDKAPIQLPLALVNREAHGIVVTWAEDPESPVLTGTENGRFTFLRPFMPDLDALFIETSKFLDFLREAWDATLVPPIADHSFSPRTGIRRVAVPRALVEEYHSDLWELLESNFESLEALYIVDLASLDTHSSGYQQLWECASPRRVAFWTNNRSWEYRSDDESLHIIQLAAQGLFQSLRGWRDRRFEIYLGNCTRTS